MASTPRPYQLAETEAHWRKPAWGLNWDMGCGKTLGTILTAARLEAAELIDGMLVVAPSGVHRQWEADELPKHLPDGLLERTRVACWRTDKAKTKRFQERIDRFMAPLRGVTMWRDFRVLVVSYDGLMTPACADVCKEFLQSGPKLLVADESHLCKSPDAKRTKRLLAMSRYAPFRRILTGTLIADNPFDAYSQIKFLDPDAWKAIGCDSFQAFKSQFGEWEQRWGARAGRFYPELLGYRNLPQMREVVQRYVSRVRKEDVLPELPPKSYARRYFELTPAQRRAYVEIRDEAMTLLAGGAEVTAPLVVTRLLRMQQVTCGYVPADDPEGDGENLVELPGGNPRLEALLEAAASVPAQAIVWAQFRQCVRRVVEGLQREGHTAVAYLGGMSEDESREAVEAFRRGDARFFVASPKKGGTGLTLNEGRDQLWYSTGWKLSERRQAEDRSHRIGQTFPVSITDLVAMVSDGEPSIDLGVLERLQSKKDAADLVTGDEVREWLTPREKP